MRSLQSYFLVFATVSLFCACGPTSNSVEKTKASAIRSAKPLKHLREEDLAKLLSVGMSKEEVFKTLGNPPFDPIPAEGGFTNLHYLFEVADRSTPEPFISGVTVVIKENKVVRWTPISRSGSPSVTTKQISPKSEQLGKDNQLVAVSLWLLTTNMIDGGRYINTEKLPKLGYIPKEPSLTITRLKSLEDVSDIEPTLRLTLVDDDAVTLQKITSENIGRKLLVMVGEHPLIAPQINTVISSGRLQIPCDDADELAQLRAALGKLLSTSP